MLSPWASSLPPPPSPPPSLAAALLLLRQRRPLVEAHAPMGGGGGTGKKRSPAKALVAGGISGAIEAVVSYPTEYVKTNLQLFEEKSRLGPIRVARETIAKDGVLGLYRGIGPGLTRSLLANGMVGPGEGRSFPDAFIGR
jgi:hypothetical protein